MPIGLFFVDELRTPPPIRWRLVRLDPPAVGQMIEGQFQAERYVESASTTWGRLAIPKREAPHIVWIRGEEETSTFGARLYSVDPARDIKAEIAAIKSTIKPDPLLGRPPQWRFVWGQIQLDCVVESVGDVRYDELWQDGRIKGVSFAITLLKVPEALPISPTDPSAPEHLSRYKPIVSGDTYESLARSQYQDPMIGVLLRQEALKAFPKPGDTVRLPNARHFLRKPRRPSAYALGDADAARAARTQHFDSYSGGREMPFIVQG